MHGTEVPWTFLVVAVVASGLSAWKAFGAFAVETKDKAPAWWLHQIWFNFAGAFVGWTAAWVYGRQLIPCLVSTCTGDASWSDAGLALVAFVGVTGHIPLATMGLIQGVLDLAKSVLALVPKKAA